MPDTIVPPTQSGPLQASLEASESERTAADLLVNQSASKKWTSFRTRTVSTVLMLGARGPAPRASPFPKKLRTCTSSNEHANEYE